MHVIFHSVMRLNPLGCRPWSMMCWCWRAIYSQFLPVVSLLAPSLVLSLKVSFCLTYSTFLGRCLFMMTDNWSHMNAIANMVCVWRLTSFWWVDSFNPVCMLLLTLSLLLICLSGVSMTCWWKSRLLLIIVRCFEGEYIVNSRPRFIIYFNRLTCHGVIHAPSCLWSLNIVTVAMLQGENL